MKHAGSMDAAQKMLTCTEPLLEQSEEGKMPQGCLQQQQQRQGLQAALGQSAALMGMTVPAALRCVFPVAGAEILWSLLQKALHYFWRSLQQRPILWSRR